MPLCIQNVIDQANAMHAADMCSRPIVVTPSIGTMGFLSDVSSVADISVIQAAYVVPRQPIKFAGVQMQTGVNEMPDKPAILLMNVTGYQEVRFRKEEREPTREEMRVQTYDAILSGAKGIAFWAHNKDDGSSPGQPFEPPENFYQVLDSPSHYADILELSADLTNHESLFSSSVSGIVSVDSGDPDVHCKVWEVFEFGQKKNHMICANVAQNHSPYFDFISGGEVQRIQAQAQDSNGDLYPLVFDANYDFELAELDPDLVAIREISTGITNEAKTINKIFVYFDSAPASATFTYAIYADDLRDSGPNTRLFMSNPTPVPTTAGTYEFPVPDVVLEHTKTHYLLIKVDLPGVFVNQQDIRHGVRIKDTAPDSQGYQQFTGPLPLDPNYPALHWGKQMDVQVTLSGASFSSYCVEVDDSLNCTQGSITNNTFSDTFEPYAVHIYKLNE
jgi:hypothetical protein